MYHHVENPVLEQFSSPMAGVESWNILASEDFACNPAKMMSDHSLIISDNHVDHGYITMKTEGMEEVVLDTTHVNQLFFHDAVSNELIVEQNVEVGSEDPHAEIILVPNTMIKQEDIIEGGEVIVGSSVESEVVIDDHMDTHLDTDHFVIGSSIDIGSDQMDDPSFEDTKLVIDTQYDLEDPSCLAYDCGECGVVLKNRVAFKKHLKSQHGKYQKGKSKKSSKDKYLYTNKRYNCPSCTYSSQRRDKLDKHMEKHVLLDGVHPCGKRRHKPEALPQRHRHNAEEYKCPLCPYSCTVYKALRKHQKVHAAGTETFTLKLSCKICGKDRSTESEMQKHMRKHRNEEHFLCDLCNFSSVQLKKIIQHRRMHTGEKPHLCPHCSYRSARRDNLRSHVRRMHKRENMYIDTFNPNEDTPLYLTF
ncbi:zinc finger protein 629-like [Uloborus diversus]|uniref:zinc finger protein 629-like n=1 Tax=Uloborus diversus TaxID=327109 RepID=UPI002409BCA6|nr:zinc finger protein 629-like [Uloborus diversus]XP_054709866.1 zinc finger protein 629-like [Uloborus diversus]XP_054709867.1 zinc finger protein 629-like [Uloborus diversus]XP_054709868.1 zinc finger protein 629-like [Uloborus diversus]